MPPLYQTLAETEREAVLTNAACDAHSPSPQTGAIMAKGVRGSGTARKNVLSPDEMRQQRERLQAQLRELEAQDARRHAVIGRVVAHRAERDEAFAEELRGMLDREVTDRGERLCVGLPTARRAGGRRAIGSQAGMQGPITASTDDAGPTGPAAASATEAGTIDAAAE